MRQNFITVKLSDREVTLRTQEPLEKIERVVSFVNEYLEKIKKQKTFTDRVTVNLLALLNIALEYEEMREKYDILTKDVEEHVTYLINLIDDVLEKDTCGVRS